MRKTLITVLTISVGLINAQKKEIEKAFSNLDSTNKDQNSSLITEAENLMGAKTYLLSPDVLEKYYLVKGEQLYSQNKTKEALNYFSKMSDLGKTKIYSGKNESKERVYFVGKEQADQLGAGISLKESTYIPEQKEILRGILGKLVQTTNNQALTAYNGKNFKTAGEKFEELYLMLNALDSGDQIYNYYAATAYSQAELYDQAIPIYESLINANYTGVKTEYLAKNKATGKDEALDKTTFEMLKKASSDYSDFRESKTPSVEKEIYDVYAEVLIRKEKYNEAIVVIEKGLAKFPDDLKLLEKKGTAYYKSGNNDKFIQNLKDQIAKNPNDPVNYYNLGILQSSDPKTLTDAENNLKKSLELDPNNKKTLQAIFYNIFMGDDSKVIEQANIARKAGKIAEFEKILADRKVRFTKGLPYLEKWYSIDSNNKELVGTLKNIYRSVGKKDKETEMAKIEAEMK